MKAQERKTFIFTQKRSYTYGTVENINDQWIFFDAEDDEAFMLNELIEDGLEIFLSNEWVPGVLLESGDVFLHTLHQYELNNGDAVRVRKKLPYPYLEMLEELSGESFLQFTKLLNSKDISLYDCIYCHNTMQFMGEEVSDTARRGVNFLVYDNESIICSVQHHFTRGKQMSDRFEYTLQTGKRMLFTNLERKAE
ncbi:DUF2777 family protein [Bacillus alkalisoli]|uniref:DUF2777 family protein n=1 Tax=Bacillus alkalisoli TaxID=2011008 RepID=UPI000C2388C6|nr:DUF2777 family protein [Bacillus alkalisoli]